MRFWLSISLFLVPALAFAQPGRVAQTPPMGWNSWDSYGTTIDEQSFRLSAQWLAEHLKPFGYVYATIDEAWFALDPPADGSSKGQKLYLDEYGRYIPSPERFPSAVNGKGFAPLADYLHSLGLKFGIHVLQGIPKEAVFQNLPIQGSGFRGKDAANVASGCQWNADNYDLQDSAAGQAYYDSIVRLYVSWHVDLIKIDCIASRPYKGEEIRMFHDAIDKSGRNIVLSLSPGAAPLDEAANLQAYSQQWRISDDVWDVWQSSGPFPQGVNDQISRAARWIPYSGPNHWADDDMLPLGELRPSPGWGVPRASRLTPDEQRTMLNLWSIVHSPLVYGGNPAATDPFTLSLLTNPEVIAVDQHSRNTRNPILIPELAVYTAEPETSQGKYVAVFNRQDTPQQVNLPWSALGMRSSRYTTTDLWTKDKTHGQRGIVTMLAPHASILLHVTP